MSQENVEIVRRGVDAWNRSDDALRTFVQEEYAPDATLYQHPDFAESSVRQSRDEINLEYQELRRAGERHEVVVEEIAAAGERAVTALVWHAVLRGTDDPIE